MAASNGRAKIGRPWRDFRPTTAGAAPRPAQGSPNILVVLFDDVGFSDFGCYGSPIKPRPSTPWRRGPALYRLSHHGHVLDHPGGTC